MTFDPDTVGTFVRPKTSRLNRILLVGFAIQLLFPLALLGDSAWLATKRSLTLVEMGVVVGGTVWLVTAVSLLVAAKHRGILQQRLARFALLFYSIFLPISIVEIALGIYRYGLDPGPTFYTPETRLRTDPDPTITPGVDGPAISQINELGLRGPSVRILAGRDNAYKIFTLGGSTTICAYLDDSEAWPNLLMEGLNQRQDRYFVFVGNAGARSHTTPEHLEFLRRMPVLGRGDLLIFLVGINDLERTLNFGGSGLKLFYEEQIEQLRADLTPIELPAYKRLCLFRRARQVLLGLQEKVAGGRGPQPDTSSNDQNQHAQKWRQVRAESPVVPLPDLSIGLQEYRDYIQAVIDHCRRSGQRCVFLTQPTLWRADLTESEKRLLWFGRTGPRVDHPRGYVAAAGLAAAMDEFNQALIDVCERERVEVYDLAAAVPKETSIFYDDCHFNENGSRVVARLLVDWLADQPPFAQPVRGMTRNTDSDRGARKP